MKQKNIQQYREAGNPFSFNESEQLSMSAELVPYGIWEYNLNSGEIIWNENMHLLLGICEGTFKYNLLSFIRFVHPDDWHTIEKIVNSPVQTSRHLSSRFYFRIITADNKINHIEGNYKVIYNSKKEAIKLVGTCVNVTENYLTKNKLKQELDRAELYIDAVESLIVVIDQHACIRLINQYGCKITGYTKDELVGANWHDMLSRMTSKNEHKEVFNKIMRGEAVYMDYYERDIIDKNGNERTIAWRNTILREQNGEIQGVLAAGVDITEKRKAEQKLKDQNQQLKSIAWTQSHKVRKPLANIIGLLSLFETSKMNEYQLHVHQCLQQSSRELDNIVKDIVYKAQAIEM
jgi:PAS domain S-box-containing protein